MKITDFLQRRKIGPDRFRTLLTGSTGSILTTAYGETQEEADGAMVEEIRRRFYGHYQPLCLQFRGHVVLVWRDGKQWVYGHIHENHPHPSGVTSADWTSREEVERVARQHLAHNGWDEQEESSPIITHPEDQKAFATWARDEKRRLWLWRGLRSIGWSDAEIHHITGGFFHLLNVSRLQQLGDPLPLVQGNPEDRTQLIARYQAFLASEDSYANGNPTDMVRGVLAALERGELAAHFREERDVNRQHMDPRYFQAVAWVWNRAIMALAL